MKTKKWLFPIATIVAGAAFMTGCSVESESISSSAQIDSDLNTNISLNLDVNRTDFDNYDTNTLNKVTLYYAYDEDNKDNLSQYKADLDSHNRF